MGEQLLRVFFAVLPLVIAAVGLLLMVSGLFGGPGRLFRGLGRAVASPTPRRRPHRSLIGALLNRVLTRPLRRVFGTVLEEMLIRRIIAGGLLTVLAAAFPACHDFGDWVWPDSEALSPKRAEREPKQPIRVESASESETPARNR